jgi:hypothetical protein
VHPAPDVGPDADEPELRQVRRLNNGNGRMPNVLDCSAILLRSLGISLIKVIYIR